MTVAFATFLILSSIVFAVEIPYKPRPETNIFNNLKNFADYIENPPFLSIVSSSKIYTPGQMATFAINMVAISPDQECSDGFCQIQYGGWALYDSNKNVIANSASWKEVYGTYNDTVMITLPTKIGQYAFISVIDQFNMTYSTIVGCPQNWCVNESVVSKEGTVISVQAPSPTGLGIVPQPSTNFFTSFFQGLSDFISFLLSLFKGG